MRSDHHGRLPGTPNVRPSKARLRSYWKLLQEKADAGDVVAAAELIRLTRKEVGCER